MTNVRGIVVLVGCIAFLPQSSFGLGLSFPGTPNGPNVYYQDIRDTLYRFLCEPGDVESEDCPKDPAFLLKTSLVISSIESDIRTQAKQTEAAIEKESDQLREKHPGVMELRANVAKAVNVLAKTEIEKAALSKKWLELEKSKKVVDARLLDISLRLGVENLSQDELLRLTESKRYNDSQSAKAESQRERVTERQKAIETERKEQSAAIDSNSLLLAKLLGSLKVDSELLASLEAQKKGLADELKITPELKKRLSDPLPFSVEAWIEESGKPGVKELTERFKKQVDQLNRGAR